MKKSVATVAVFLLVAGITGCASQPVEDAGVTETTEVAETTEPVEVEAAPLQAAEPELGDAESTYLFEVKKRDDVQTIAEADDAALLAAGKLACEQLADNPRMSEVRVVEGEEPNEITSRYFESTVIGTHAQMFLCPDITVEPEEHLP